MSSAYERPVLIFGSSKKETKQLLGVAEGRQKALERLQPAKNLPKSPSELLSLYVEDRLAATKQVEKNLSSALEFLMVNEYGVSIEESKKLLPKFKAYLMPRLINQDTYDINNLDREELLEIFNSSKTAVAESEIWEKKLDAEEKNVSKIRVTTFICLIAMPFIYMGGNKILENNYEIPEYQNRMKGALQQKTVGYVDKGFVNSHAMN